MSSVGSYRRGSDRGRSNEPESPKKGKMRNDDSMIVIREYDHIIFIAVMMLASFGLVMILSASYYSAMNNPAGMFTFFKQQALCVALGFVGLIVAASFNYKMVSMFSVPLYAAANAMLVYVKFFGVEVNGARRWIRLPGFQFQPSEIAKVSVIFLLAVFISKNRNRVNTIPGLLGCLVIIGIPSALVFWGNNLSTAIIICAIGFCMIFVASPYFWRFVLLAGGAVSAAVVYMTFFSESFRNARFQAWRDPFSDPLKYGYQTIQSLYAVASGGLFGLGLGQSNQKLSYMPEPHNDFIFAIICEELGFFGAAIILFLFGVLVWRGIMAAVNSDSLLGTLLATGIVIMISVQVIINVAVVTNTVPNTGIPLPFISYGGTSVAIMMSLMGVLLNVSRYPKNRSNI